MEDNNLIHQFVLKVKSKFTKNSKGDPSVTEYVFSSEEVEKISEENKQKMLELKQEAYPKKVKKELSVLSTLNKMKETKTDSGEAILKEDNLKKESLDAHSFSVEDSLVDSQKLNSQEEKVENEETLENLVEDTVREPVNSFVEINADSKKIVMENWNAIDIREIDKDIMEGKEILNHNYTITYADEAEKFIHDIRKKYEIVICYLIGFNNEKRGMFDKTIFSAKMDDEWQFLGQYIKILERIRNFKK